MQINDILYYLLDAPSQIEATEIIAKAVVGKIVFENQFEKLLSVNVISRDRIDDKGLAEMLYVGRREVVGDLFALRFHEFDNAGG